MGKLLFFLLGLLSGFLLDLVFCILSKTCLDVVVFIFLGVLEFPGSMFWCLSLILEISQSLSLHIFLQFLSFTLDLPITCMLHMLLWSPTVLEYSVACFFSLFSLHLSLGVCHFRFTDELNIPFPLQ